MEKLSIRAQREHDYRKAREIIARAFQDYKVHFYTAFANEFWTKRRGSEVEKVVASMLTSNGTIITGTHLNRYMKDKYYRFPGDVKTFADWNVNELDPWLRADEEILQDRKHRTSQMIKKNMLPPCKVHLNQRLLNNMRNCICEEVV